MRTTRVTLLCILLFSLTAAPAATRAQDEAPAAEGDIPAPEHVTWMFSAVMRKYVALVSEGSAAVEEVMGMRTVQALEVMTRVSPSRVARRGVGGWFMASSNAT